MTRTEIIDKILELAGNKFDSKDALLDLAKASSYELVDVYLSHTTTKVNTNTEVCPNCDVELNSTNFAVCPNCLVSLR